MAKSCEKMKVIDASEEETSVNRKTIEEVVKCKVMKKS